MTRIGIFVLLGCAFVSVQAHVVRQRVRRQEDQLAVSHAGARRHSDEPGSRLGGGTTRALSEASDPLWQPAAATAIIGSPALAVAPIEPSAQPDTPSTALSTLRILRI